MRRCWNINAFTINCKLPSLNEWWYALSSNKYMGSKFKKEIEEVISWSIRQALASNTLHKPNGAVILNIEWTEANKKRDLDNIVSAKKFILDALVKTGVLENDSQRYVKGFYDTLKNGKEYSVKVELIEIQ